MHAKTMDELAAYVGQTLKVRELAPDAGMGRTRGWDSLAIEQWAGVSVPPELMGELTTLSAIALYLGEQGAIKG